MCPQTQEGLREIIQRLSNSYILGSSLAAEVLYLDNRHFIIFTRHIDCQESTSNPSTELVVYCTVVWNIFVFFGPSHIWWHIGHTVMTFMFYYISCLDWIGCAGGSLVEFSPATRAARPVHQVSGHTAWKVQFFVRSLRSNGMDLCCVSHGCWFGSPVPKNSIATGTNVFCLRYASPDTERTEMI